MKKIYPLICLLLACSFVYAQKPIRVDETFSNAQAKEYIKLSKDPVQDQVGVKDNHHPPFKSFNEEQLGTTYYDLHSNTMVSNRNYYDPVSGTGAVVWTRGMTSPNFPDRGSGYNYYDGTSWLPEPTSRIEDERTGWPTYAPLGANGEIIIAHLNEGLKMSKREQKGTGEWSYSIIDGPEGASELAWPRIITNGEDHNTVHLLANSYTAYNGQEQALLYYRSFDGGETWDKAGEVFDELGPDYITEIYSESYAWAEPRGDTIAFVLCSGWHDLIVMKSYDNGESWEKIVAWEHPYPLFDWDVTVTDTFFAVDNSASIVLDPEGRAHVAFGISYVYHDAPGTTFYFFGDTDGIGYWNEDMDAFSNNLNALSPPQYEMPNSELIEDVNYVGWTQDVDGDGEITLLENIMDYGTIGLSTQPTLILDDEGRLFLAYASTTETYDNFDYNFKHIWARAWSEEIGWTTFIDITGELIHLFDECVYPLLAGGSDDHIYLSYCVDDYPGVALEGDHDYVENSIIYTNINKAEFYPWGVEDPGSKRLSLEVSANYPNPCTSTTNINVSLDHPAKVELTVTDLLGKEVQSENFGLMTAGKHVLEINTSEIPVGIYFYSVNTGSVSVTRKMIKNN